MALQEISNVDSLRYLVKISSRQARTIRFLIRSILIDQNQSKHFSVWFHRHSICACIFEMKFSYATVTNIYYQMFRIKRTQRINLT